MTSAYQITLNEAERLRQYCKMEWGEATCNKYHSELQEIIKDENTTLVLAADILTPAIDQNRLEELVAEGLKEKSIKFNQNQLKKIAISMRVIGLAYKQEYGL